MDMEKHAAALEHSFAGGFLDELEKVAGHRGLTDLEKLALIEQAGKLIGRGAKWLGGKLTQSGDDAAAKAMKGPKGEVLGPTRAGKGRSGKGRGMRDWGKKIEEGGEAAKDVGLLGLGAAGVGTAGVGGAAVF